MTWTKEMPYAENMTEAYRQNKEKLGFSED